MFPHYMHFLELHKLGLHETRSILIISAKIERADDIKEHKKITDALNKCYKIRSSIPH